MFLVAGGSPSNIYYNHIKLLNILTSIYQQAPKYTPKTSTEQFEVRV
jgi:hypothetical protein